MQVYRKERAIPNGSMRSVLVQLYAKLVLAYRSAEQLATTSSTLRSLRPYGLRYVRI